jgi:HK97 family phage major capsid protein
MRFAGGFNFSPKDSPMPKNPFSEMPEASLLTTQAALRSEADTILSRSAETLSEIDAVRGEEIATELAQIGERLEWFERIKRFANTRPEMSGDGANVSIHMNRTPSSFDSDNRDPIESRARQAVEQNDRASDEAKAAAVELIERAGDDRDAIAEHIFRSTHPAYVSAFEKAVRSPEYFRSELTAEEATQFQAVNTWYQRGDRAAMSQTAANGGYLVPQFLDPSIILTNRGTVSDVRSIARVVSTPSAQWQGVSSAGVSAEWLSEGSEAADATPTFAGPTITPQKWSAWVFGSYEVLADSGFNDIAMLIEDARSTLESAAWISGTGSGQPYGLITRLSGAGPVINGTSGAAGSATISLADLYAMDNQLAPRFRGNAKWLAAKPIYNSIRALAANTYSLWSDFGAGISPTLLGYEARRAEDMDSTIVSGSNDFALILGDFSNYVIVDRIGTTIAYQPMVMGANQRPTGQAGWFAYGRTGADVITSNAFAVLKL